MNHETLRKGAFSEDNLQKPRCGVYINLNLAERLNMAVEIVSLTKKVFKCVSHLQFQKRNLRTSSYDALSETVPLFLWDTRYPGKQNYVARWLAYAAEPACNYELRGGGSSRASRPRDQPAGGTRRRGRRDQVNQQRKATNFSIL